MAPVVYCRRVIRVYLGHGASGTAASMRPWVDGLRERGFEAHALELPKRKAEEAVAAYEGQVPDEPGAVIGGHSFGGRVASLAVAGVRVAGAAPRAHPYAGLVCLSYPLHPPGRPESTDARIAHWPAIFVPALLLSGTSDPFARIELLEAAMPKLPDGRLVTYPKLGHGLLPVREDALDRIVEFLRGLEPG
jgi:predicted alpha/beta-hydrolase family hydrolase